MGIIFYFSSGPTDSVVADPLPRFILFKSLHIFEYTLLTVLLFFAFLKYKQTIIIAYLYAISDEFHQYFVPGRTSRFRDTLIDLIGIFIGIFIFQKIISLKCFKRVKNNLY